MHKYRVYTVRPLVESNSSVWNRDILYINNTNHIDNIQKISLNDYFLDVIGNNIPKYSYTDRIIVLNIKSLSRRLVSYLVLTYKILNGFY